MRSNFIFTALVAAWGVSVSAAPTKGSGFIQNNASKEHESGGKEYVVLFDNKRPTPPDVQDILNRIKLSPESADVIHTFNNSQFGGFVAKMKTHCLDALNAMEEVAEVEEAVSIRSFDQFTNYPWGTQRISSSQRVQGNPRDRAFTYTFDDAKLGAGVDIYILDTGVRDTHEVFGGRAIQGLGLGGITADGDGHGTHVAGTAAGNFFGVASQANIIAVKILNDDGAGSSTQGMQGIEFVINRHNQRKSEPGFVGSIMSMSWGFPLIAQSMDRVILAASQAGIHASVAAGNDGRNACASSPARNGGGNSNIVTVGATDINDRIATFSNTGPCVDIYAPGVSIISSWSTGDNVINSLSGTSMACPHVTGVMAYLMAQDPALGQDPAALKAKLLSLSRKNVVLGPSIEDTETVMLSNGADGARAQNSKRQDGGGAVDWELAEGDFSRPVLRF